MKGIVIFVIAFLVCSGPIFISPVKAQITGSTEEQTGINIPDQGVTEEMTKLLLGNFTGLLIPGQATNPRFPIEIIISDNSPDAVTATFIRDKVIVRNKEVVKCTRKSADVISLDFKQGSYDMLLVTFNLKTSMMHVSYMQGRGLPSEGDIKKK